MNFHKQSTLGFRKDLRKRATFPERLVWAKLRNLGLGYRFKRQIGIDRFIVDFYSPKARLIIEIDGGYHRKPEIVAYDLDRDAFMRGLGYEVLRFTNEEVLSNLMCVINKIDEVGKKRLNGAFTQVPPDSA